MLASKTTRSTTARKSTVVVLAASNQLALPPQQNVVVPRVLVLSHPDQGRASHVARSVPVNLVEILVPIPNMQHETLPDFHTLQVSLDVQGTNKLLNNVFNIVRQRNSNGIEERF